MSGKLGDVDTSFSKLRSQHFIRGRDGLAEDVDVLRCTRIPVSCFCESGSNRGKPYTDAHLSFPPTSSFHRYPQVMSDPSQPASQSQSSGSAQEIQKVQRFISSIPPSSESASTNVTFDSQRDSNEVRIAMVELGRRMLCADPCPILERSM
jgi:hypothetical protein